MDEKLKLIQALTGMFVTLTGKPPIDGQVPAYVMALEDLPTDKVISAVSHWTRTRKWPAKPVEIRELVDPPQDPESLAMAAWEVLNKWLHVGPYRIVQFDDPLITACVRNMGGWVYITDIPTDQWETWKKKEFAALYQNYLEHGVSDDSSRPLDSLCNDPKEKITLLGDARKSAPRIGHDEQYSEVTRDLATQLSRTQ